MDTPNTVPVVDPQNPWPGLLSFPEEAERFFNGRDAERDELVRLVRRDTLTLLYGHSGLGKSSLLLAGVFPVLRRERFLPVYVRLDHAESSPAHDRQLRAALLAACAEHGVTAPDSPDEDGTWELLHRAGGFWDAKSYPVTPVLVIDQFEEIFTLGATTPERRGRAGRFMEQLGDLIDNHPPDTLLDRLSEQPDEAAHFAFSSPAYRIVLSLREDYLADLRQLREHTSSTMQNELRLRHMRGDRALEAVDRTGGEMVEPGAAEVIVRAVARAQGATRGDGEADKGNEAKTDALPLSALEVEPALLSMVCSQLNERRKADGLATITAKLLKATRDEIMEDFYVRSFAGLNPAVRVFVEERLLTESGYHRNFAALDDAVLVAGVTREDLHVLEARRVLRVEDRFGTRRVEITHDVLTDPARISRDRRRAQERRAAERRAQAGRRRKQIVAGALALLIIVGASIGAVGWTTWRKGQLDAQEAALEDEQEKTRDALQDAEKATLIAAESQRAFVAARVAARRAQADAEALQGRLTTKQQELERQAAAAEAARSRAVSSEQTSRVGGEAAQYYRSMTGRLLARSTEASASAATLSDSVDAILRHADEVRRAGEARADSLMAAVCEVVASDTLQARIFKEAGRGTCRPAQRPSVAQQGEP